MAAPQTRRPTGITGRAWTDQTSTSMSLQRDRELALTMAQGGFLRTASPGYGIMGVKALDMPHLDMRLAL